MYTLIGSPSSRAFRVLWMLEELELEYELVRAAPQSAEIRAINPSGKVPALKIGEEVLIDSTAICTHLVDHHQKFTFPAGSVQHAKMMSLIFFVLDELERPLWNTAGHRFATPEEVRVPDAIQSAHWIYGRGLKNLTKRFGEGPFLCGEAFTVADVMLGHVLGWARAFKFEDPPEPIAEYFSRLRSRPAYLRAKELRSAK